jgi:hypothetical protein
MNGEDSQSEITAVDGTEVSKKVSTSKPTRHDLTVMPGYESRKSPPRQHLSSRHSEKPDDIRGKYRTYGRRKVVSMLNQAQCPAEYVFGNGGIAPCILNLSSKVEVCGHLCAPATLAS